MNQTLNLKTDKGTNGALCFLYGEAVAKGDKETFAIRDIDKRTKKIYFSSPLTNATSKTLNNKLYSKERMDRAMANPFFDTRLKNRSLFGERDHPSRADTSIYIQVNNGNRSHRFNKLWWDGNLLMGDIENANSEPGDDLYRYILDEAIPAFSLRAYDIPNPTEPGGVEFRLLTWDWIFTPACIEAWANLKNNLYLNDLIAARQSGNMYVEGSFGEFITAHDVVGQEITTYMESNGLSNVKKILYDDKKQVLGLYTESTSQIAKVGDNLRQQLVETFY